MNDPCLSLFSVEKLYNITQHRMPFSDKNQKINKRKSRRIHNDCSECTLTTPKLIVCTKQKQKQKTIVYKIFVFVLSFKSHFAKTTFLQI